jgi:hypothetical protein
MNFDKISRTPMKSLAKRWRMRRGRFIVPTADLSAFGVDAPHVRIKKSNSIIGGGRDKSGPTLAVGADL